MNAPRDYRSLGEAIDFEIQENGGNFTILLQTQNPNVTLEEDQLTIKVKNEKEFKTTQITVNKKWFRPDGEVMNKKDGSITYDLIQVQTTEDGIVSSNVYKSKETISAADGWTKTYEKLPLTGKMKDGEEVTYSYYVREKEDKDYDTSYMKNN